MVDWASFFIGFSVGMLASAVCLTLGYFIPIVIEWRHEKIRAAWRARED